MKVAIVEDHALFRDVMRKVCTDELRLEVVGEADDGLQAIQMLRRAKPDLLLLDLGLPSLDGLSVGELALAAQPSLKIIILSSNCNAYTVYCAERIGVHGFVDKDTGTVAALKAAVTAVAASGLWFSIRYKRAHAERARNPISFDKVLTPREREILGLIGLPLTDREIAARLRISWETVEKHRFSILTKLKLDDTAALVRYARATGMTPLSLTDAPWNPSLDGNGRSR